MRIILTAAAVFRYQEDCRWFSQVLRQTKVKKHNTLSVPMKEYYAHAIITASTVLMTSRCSLLMLHDPAETIKHFLHLVMGIHSTTEQSQGRFYQAGKI